MKKLTIDELEKLRSHSIEKMRLRESGGNRGKITVHMGTCGIAAGARDVLTAVLDIFEEKKISDILVTTSGCAGLCSSEPMVTVEMFNQAPVKYVHLDKSKIKQIIEKHILNNKIVPEYALAIGSERVG